MKHNSIVKNIYRRLNKNSSIDDIICREEEYLSYGCGVGEVDVYRVHEGVAVAVEVKTNDHEKARRKAYHQLEKDAIYLHEFFKIKKYTGFYAYTNKYAKRGYNVEKVIEYDFRK